jgi:hypothetical protein
MKLRVSLVLLAVISFGAVAFAGDDPGLPGKNAPAVDPSTVQAVAPDSGATATDAEKPHKKHHHNNKHHKKHGKHTKKHSGTTDNTTEK